MGTVQNIWKSLCRGVGQKLCGGRVFVLSEPQSTVSIIINQKHFRHEKQKLIDHYNFGLIVDWKKREKSALGLPIGHLPTTTNQNSYLPLSVSLFLSLLLFLILTIVQPQSSLFSFNMPSILQPNTFKYNIWMNIDKGLKSNTFQALTHQ